MDIIQKLGLCIWYGAFVLMGITIGLIISPGIARADTVYDNITNAPSGSYTAVDVYTDQAYFNTTDSWQCVVGYTDTALAISSITLVVAPDVSSLYGNEIVMRFWDLGTATSSLVGTIPTSYTASNNVVTLSSLTTSWATSTWTFTNLNISAGHYYCLSFYDITETTVSGTNAVQVRTNTYATSTGFVLVYPDATANGARITAYDDNDDISAFSSIAGLHKALLAVNGYDNTSEAITYLKNPYPVNGQFDVSTTSDYVAISVNLPYTTYSQYDDWYLSVECDFTTDASMLFGFGNITYQYYENITDLITPGVDSNPMGVSWPPESYWQDDQVIRCTADLRYDKPWSLFRPVLESYSWEFYTIESATSSAYVEYQIHGPDGYISVLNTTGTSTDGVFAACTFTDFNPRDCAVAPFVWAFVPSDSQKDTIIADYDEIMETNFPFYLIGTIMSVTSSSTEIASTTEYQLPTMAFNLQNYDGGTTTVTILSGSTFTESWSQIDEFASIKQILTYLLIVGYVILMYNRVKRLAPTSVAIQD